MIDQPVTPDREALEAVIRTRIREHIQRVGISGWTTANAAAIAADACTEALDRAEQRGCEKVAGIAERMREDVLRASPRRPGDRDRGLAMADAYEYVARLARGADRKADG